MLFRSASDSPDADDETADTPKPAQDDPVLKKGIEVLQGLPAAEKKGQARLRAPRRGDAA